MRMNKITPLILLLLLVLVVSSCKFSKLLKSTDNEKKYAAAVKLYEEKNYSRAQQLFDQLSTAMKATDKAERIFYYYAYSYYYMKEYTMASYYFKRYSNNFPNLPTAEECNFMSAYCNYLNSPEYSLDQTSTKDAIRDLQLFINVYPKSTRVNECNDLIDKLRAKLELKAFRIAKMYYRMDDYLAAITSLNSILKDYPDTQRKEEILFLIFKSNNKFAQESIESKKKERLLKAIASYNDLATLYPQSQYLDEAKSLKTKSQKELDLQVSSKNK